MSDINVEALLQQLQLNPDLFQTLTLGQIFHFISLASCLKDDILLTHPAKLSATNLPDVLPPTITGFLGNSCDLPQAYVEQCWDILKHTIWDSAAISCDHLDSAFTQHGHHSGLSMSYHLILLKLLTYLWIVASHTLYPPQHKCSNADCLQNKKGLLLKKAEQRQAVLYTLDKGPLPTYSIHLYCEGMSFHSAQTQTIVRLACKINHHHNYSIKNGQHTYYDDIPDIIQVGEHQFVGCRVIHLWINLMLISWWVSFLSNI